MTVKSNDLPLRRQACERMSIGDQGRSDKQTQEAKGDKAAKDLRIVTNIGISMPKPMSPRLMKLSTIPTNRP